ncbi:hypothetical protein ACFWPK_17860 [Nocardia sp. NPDC058519]|uniref:hypothetical protein n=1 Tax=Nocardia sp. NPDC058519 TaxID=3346535 RepID=UPI0036581BBD
MSHPFEQPEPVKAENHWVSPDKTRRIDFEVWGAHVHGYGSPAVRFQESSGEVWLSLGGRHRDGGTPILRMSVAAAGELATLLSRANLDGLIGQGVVPAELAQPYRDVTCEPCDCLQCVATALAEDRNREVCDCPQCLTERVKGQR